MRLSTSHDYGKSSYRKLAEKTKMSAESELSYSILNICGDGPKEIFKILEKNVVKLTMHNSRLSFNETALNNCLLPNYANICIYINFKSFSAIKSTISFIFVYNMKQFVYLVNIYIIHGLLTLLTYERCTSLDCCLPKVMRRVYSVVSVNHQIVDAHSEQYVFISSKKLSDAGLKSWLMLNSLQFFELLLWVL